jgi:voltage-gated potassium channel
MTTPPPAPPAEGLWSRADVIAATAALLLAVVIPFEYMAFRADAHHPALAALRWLGYAVLVADLIVRTRAGHYRDRSLLRTIDTAASLPLGPALAFVLPGLPHLVLVAVYLLPLLRLGRVYLLARAWQQARPARTGLRRVLTTIATVGLLVHWIGCAQLAVYAAAPDTPFTLRYLQALYWTVTTMTTVGYGDIAPDRTAADQLLFTMLIMGIGAAAFGLIVGNITTIMTNLDFARNQHLDRMQRLNAFMRHHAIPLPLQEKVNQTFSHLWQTRRGFDENAVLNELPPSLRQEFELHLRRDIVSKVPFFQEADNTLVYRLVAAMRPQIALPGDMLCRRDDPGDTMFFIASGSVEVIRPDGTLIATLGDGAFFGEMSLVDQSPRTADVRAVTLCDLYTLDRPALFAIMADHPDFDRHVRGIAAQRRQPIPPPGSGDAI